ARLKASRSSEGRSATLSGERAVQQPPPQVPFRAGVELVSLNVTVTDGTQKYITDLAQDEFNVFEDGVKQDVTFFNRTNLPIALAKRSETAIYSIGLRTPDGPGTTTKGFKEAEFVLRQFSQETGGRSFFPSQLSDLTNVYGQIADELSSQYTVGYTSRNPKRD